MSTAEKPPARDAATADWPDHTRLPDSDGAIVENYQQLPLATALMESIKPVLDAIHPDGQYAMASDSGIYWKFTDPPLKGCKAPDWYYVPGVPPGGPDGAPFRRSYVLWKELVPPLIVLEFVSGDGSEERDTTPNSGKFWVYERAIRAKYYGIFESELERIEMHERVDGLYRPMTPNARGRFPILELGIELGPWHGVLFGMDLFWMRWFDADGVLLPSDSERAGQNADRATREADRATREADRATREADRATREADRATREADRAERLAAQLRALGIEPEA